MKKLFQILLSFITLQSFAQSVEIKPNDEKLMISSYTENPIIIGRRSGFTSGIPTSTTANSTLLFLSGRGYSDGDFRTNSAASILFRANQNFSSTAGGSHILFQTTADNTTTATERMRIAHDGNVGIGTNTPLSFLHISGGASGVAPNSSPGLFIEDDRNTYLNLAAPNANETGVLFGRPDDTGTSGGIIYRSNKDMHLRTNGNATRFRILNNGNVAVGDASFTPNTKFSVDGDITLRKKTSYSTIGTLSNLVRNGASVIRLDGVGEISLSGIEAADDGTLLFVYTTSNVSKLTLLNEDAGSTSANRILVGNSNLINKDGSATLIYDALAQRWRVLSINVGGGAGSGIFPRLTYDDILALQNPHAGDIAYDISFQCFRVFNGTNWASTNKTEDSTLPDVSATVIGGADSEVTPKIAVDESGNIYMVGKFIGTTTFGNTTLTSSGVSDLFIAKYSSGGTLLWVQQVSGTGSENVGDVAVDGSGNVYFAGSFTGSSTFGTTNIASYLGSTDIFIAKYNTNGVFQWVRRAGHDSVENVSGIALDASGNAYITGSFDTITNFNGTNYLSSGFSDVYVAKYNSSGTFQWVRFGNGDFPDYPVDIEADASGNVYVAGVHESDITFGTVTLPPLGFSDIFFISYNSSGTLQYAKNIGGSGYDDVTGIALTNGTLYMTGTFENTASFIPQSLTSKGFRDIFIAKYIASVGSLAEVANIGSKDIELGGKIDTDADGNIFLLGRINKIANFNNTSFVPTPSRNNFLIKLDTDFNVYYSMFAYGNIVCGPNNRIYLYDSFNNTLNQGPLVLTPSGGADIYLVTLQE